MSFKYFGVALLVSGVVVTAAAEANAACASGLSCEMCNVSGYTPALMAAPIGPTSGDCTDQDVQDFDVACLATSATQATCSQWESNASPSCLACLVSQDTASKWGFLVCDSTGCQLNVPGCVDVALGTIAQEKQAGGAGSCGDAINASYGCQSYACNTCTGNDFTTCANSAVANECASYDAPVESTTGPCMNLQNSTQAQTCFAQDEQSEVAMATYMCGGGIAPPPDAGPPPNDSGTTKPDSGTTKPDSGTKPGDGGSGSDAGSSFGGKGGCHCDAAGGGGDSLAFIGFTAALAAAFARRKRKP